MNMTIYIIHRFTNSFWPQLMQFKWYFCRTNDNTHMANVSFGPEIKDSSFYPDTADSSSNSDIMNSGDDIPLLNQPSDGMSDIDPENLKGLLCIFESILFTAHNVSDAIHIVLDITPFDSLERLP